MKVLSLEKLTEFVELVKTNFASKTDLNNKVDKVGGKQLSTNDYTTAEKNKLATLEPLTVKSVKVNGSPLVPDGSKAVNVDLSGYAVKTEVTQEIAQAVSGITGFDTQAVEELPGTGKKKGSYIYCLIVVLETTYMMNISGWEINMRSWEHVKLI